MNRLCDFFGPSVIETTIVEPTVKNQVKLAESILPDDLLIEIFSYFMDREDHIGFELVCRRWNAVATNNDILRPLLEANKVILPTHPVPQGYFYQFELFSRRASRLFIDYSKEQLFQGIRQKLNPTPLLSFLKANEKFLGQLHLLIMYPFSKFTSTDILQSCMYISNHCPNLEVVDLSYAYDIDQRVKITSIALFKLKCPKLSDVLIDKHPEPAVQQVHEHFLPLKKRPDMDVT